MASQRLGLRRASRLVELPVASHLELELNQLEVPVESQHHQQVQSQQHLNLLPLVGSLLLQLEQKVEQLGASQLQLLEARLLQEKLQELSLQPQEESLQRLLEGNKLVARLEPQEGNLLVARQQQVQEKLVASKVLQLLVGRQQVELQEAPKSREQRHLLLSLLLVPSRVQELNQQLERRGQQGLLPRDLLPRNKPVEQRLPRKQPQRNQEPKEQPLAKLVPRVA